MGNWLAQLSREKALLYVYTSPDLVHPNFVLLIFEDGTEVVASHGDFNRHVSFNPSARNLH